MFFRNHQLCWGSGLISVIWLTLTWLIIRRPFCGHHRLLNTADTGTSHLLFDGEPNWHSDEREPVSTSETPGELVSLTGVGLTWTNQWPVLTHAWTKLVVPSMGSMIQVGSSVKTLGSPAATDSSPMNLKHMKPGDWLVLWCWLCPLHINLSVSRTRTPGWSHLLKRFNQRTYS